LTDKPFVLKGKGCISCGQCAPACPKDLLPDQLLKLGNGGLWEQADELNLQDCIECSLCDRVCPSEINLAQFFAHGKVIEQQRLAENVEKQRIQDRFENHQSRLQAKQEEGNQRRQQRMNERLQRLQQSRSGDQ
jgi:electron transport complex protein RnfC